MVNANTVVREDPSIFNQIQTLLVELFGRHLKVGPLRRSREKSLAGSVRIVFTITAR